MNILLECTELLLFIIIIYIDDNEPEKNKRNSAEQFDEVYVRTLKD